MSKRINVVLSDELNAQVRERCAQEGRTISGVIQSCLTRFVAGEPAESCGGGNWHASGAQVATAAHIARMAIDVLGRGVDIKIHCDDVPASLGCTEQDRQTCVCLRCSAFQWGLSFVVESVPVEGGTYVSIYTDDMVRSDMLPSVRVSPWNHQSLYAQLVADSGDVVALDYRLLELTTEQQKSAMARAMAMIGDAIKLESM